MRDLFTKQNTWGRVWMIVFGMIVICGTALLFVCILFYIPSQNTIQDTSAEDFATSTQPILEEYTGPIHHIFFHSLIIYPQKALTDLENIKGYKNNMITVVQFKQILEQLYANNFILINDNLLYSFDESGHIHKNTLLLPVGKKPLILSVDDLSYYSYMKNGGFAHKLVLENGVVKTEVITPDQNTIITDDGDVIPIVDSFVQTHPDFSYHGAKGIIGLTGFEGILGYRTRLRGAHGAEEKERAKQVVDALKNSGWVFANHSFGHEQDFLKNTATLDFIERDLSHWKKEIEPLVGYTPIFIGPFGQIFTEGDPRRQKIIDAGFPILYGVGMDSYMHFFDNHFVMNRIDIDGYRLEHNAKQIYDMFGISVDTSL